MRHSSGCIGYWRSYTSIRNRALFIMDMEQSGWLKGRGYQVLPCVWLGKGSTLSPESLYHLLPCRRLRARSRYKAAREKIALFRMNRCCEAHGCLRTAIGIGWWVMEGITRHFLVHCPSDSQVRSAANEKSFLTIFSNPRGFSAQPICQ